MESHNLSIITFCENIRKRMQANKTPLIRHRRQLPLFRQYSDVFLGSEAVAWAIKTLSINDEDDSTQVSSLTESHACSLFQKLMDAGLLQNVTTQEQFKNDKSLYRFSSDNTEMEKLIRSVAIGYRLYDSARSSDCILFQRVCALGQLVSCECLKSCDIVTWLVKNGSCTSRDLAAILAQDMVESDVLKPVDSEIKQFEDGSAFYLFAIDYKQPSLTVKQFLRYSIACTGELSPSNPNSSSRNKLIHLRQSSDQLVDFDSTVLRGQRKVSVDRKKGISTSSDDSGFDDRGSNISSSASYETLLNSDGSMTKEALFHPNAPYLKKSIWIFPDPLGYGFVIRGTGPCFVKIVDPDSPAGRAGVKAGQYIAYINRHNVTEMGHTAIEDLILKGPKFVKVTVMQHKDTIEKEPKSPPVIQKSHPVVPVTPTRQRSCPPLPSAQPWIKQRPSIMCGGSARSMRHVGSQ